MDYGSPRLLPNTGAVALFGFSIWQQLWIALAVALLVVGGATLIRKHWRKDQSLSR